MVSLNCRHQFVKFGIHTGIRKCTSDILIHEFENFLISVFIKVRGIFDMNFNMKVFNTFDLKLLLIILIKYMPNWVYITKDNYLLQLLQEVVNLLCHNVRIPIKVFNFGSPVHVIYLLICQFVFILSSNYLNNVGLIKFNSWIWYEESICIELSNFAKMLYSMLWKYYGVPTTFLNVKKHILRNHCLHTINI